MSKIQKFFKFILPSRLFQKIEEESKKWFILCNKCGYLISYWEAGGIKAGGSTWKKRVFGVCPNCKKVRFFSVIKKG